MEKYLNDSGEVAVIIARGFKNKWFTKHKIEDLIYDPGIVEILLCKETPVMEKALEIEQYCDNVYGELDHYGDSTNLEVIFVPKGTVFEIRCIEGEERIVERQLKEDWKEA